MTWGVELAVFHAYFDDSGKESDRPVWAVGGYLIRADKARQMKKKWQLLLRRFGLPYFHMVDCAPAPGNGVFKKLSSQDRDNVARQCIQLIKDHVAAGFVILMNPKKFDRTLPGHSGDPYAFACESCLMSVDRWLTEKIGPSRIKFFFEAGSAGQASAMARVAQHGIELPSEHEASTEFSPKADVPLLQAADLLAWQSTKHIKDAIFNGRKVRKDFLSLIEVEHNFIMLKVINKKIEFEIYKPSQSPNTILNDAGAPFRATFAD